MKPANNQKIERALKGLLTMLLIEFVLGVLLTTVINYQPDKHSTLQDAVLILHILIGIGLVIGSVAHAVATRSSHLLGLKPIKGVVFIIAAFAAGGMAAGSGNSWAVLVMALCFGAAITNYGLSYVKIRSISAEK